MSLMYERESILNLKWKFEDQLICISLSIPSQEFEIPIKGILFMAIDGRTGQSMRGQRCYIVILVLQSCEIDDWRSFSDCGVILQIRDSSVKNPLILTRPPILCVRHEGRIASTASRMDRTYCAHRTQVLLQCKSQEINLQTASNITTSPNSASHPTRARDS